MKLIRAMVLFLLVLLAGFASGIFWADHVYPEFFEKLTGVPYGLFLDEKEACETAYEERCKIYGGFAPESLFAE